MSGLISYLEDLYRNIVNIFQSKPFISWRILKDPKNNNLNSNRFKGRKYKVNTVFTGRDNLNDLRTQFSITHDNLRETVISKTTGSFNRQRQLVATLSIALFGEAYFSLPEITDYINKHQLKFYTVEANSALFNRLQKRIDPKLFFFSEYFGKKYKSGSKVNGIMNQDLQKTSFPDNTFDIIITAEVMEHVPDAIKAEAEIVRILKPGGLYIFTLPFGYSLPKDQVLATVKNGKIIYYEKAQYHGDPIRPEKGILVYRIFSYIDLKKRFEKLRCSYNCFQLYSDQVGIIGQDIFTHIVKKSTR